MSDNVIQFPVKYREQESASPFPILSRKDGCYDGMRQTFDDGMPEYETCGWCNGEGCK